MARTAVVLFNLGGPDSPSAVRPFLDDAQNAMLQAELKHQAGLGKLRIPKAAIHGDLFRDNVLFSGGRVRPARVGPIRPEQSRRRRSPGGTGRR